MAFRPNCNDNLLLRLRYDDAGHEGFIMSQRLNSIQNTCPIFDKLKSECDEIRGYIKGEDPPCPTEISWIQQSLDLIESLADDIRNTAGELRDTASDIADSKNSEIEELESRIEELESELEEAKSELDELKSEEVC